MPKERINVSIDQSVKRQLDAREDINVSGLVNSFLRRYLRGETQDKATDRIKAERLREEAKEKRNKAQSLEQQAKSIMEEHKKKKREKEETWKKVVDVLTDDEGLNSVAGQYQMTQNEEALEYWAGELNITKQELVDKMPEKYEQYKDANPGGRGFQ